MKKLRPIIQDFLGSETFAVAGASVDRQKYGNKVFRALLKSGRLVYPLNPHADLVEGHAAYASLAELPAPPAALSMVTPPSVTRQIVPDAIAAGVRIIWMQPGAEDRLAGQLARSAGVQVIDDGSCVLVQLALLDR